MKKNIYRMKSYIGEIFEASVDISEKEFKAILNKNLDYLHDPDNQFQDYGSWEVWENGKVNDEGYTYRKTTREHERYTITEHIFGCGISALYLQHAVAKDGYGFN